MDKYSFPVLAETNLPLPLGYRGKVRDVYKLGSDSDFLLVVATDRISAFDKVLRQKVPHKGTFLNQPSAYVFEKTTDIVPNHFVSIPDPNAMVVRKTEPLSVELVIRGYLGGSALREYKEGKRKFFVETLPDGLRDYEKLKNPIITPTTKAKIGHDQPIETMEDFIVAVGDKALAYELIEKGIALYYIGNEMARINGGGLFDTKAEFGKDKSHGKPRLLLIDEIFTHDSSRVIRLDEYMKAFELGKEPRFIDKEPVRKWLSDRGFRGEGPIPDLPEGLIRDTTDRGIEAARLIMSDKFELPTEPPTNERIMRNLKDYNWL
ncbi:MAG: phosphoribosylaminoimidazolesuccinocarboxamide synthase [Candidatus Aenigmarchaeota archaeon]|nr:phosphoribosylaminoimidazolesuccinocarboxamide synthase [Candidatus Aenigmarchaeota archaeon]